MNYINISTDNLKELKSIRDLVVKELDSRNEEDTFYQKLQEDLWDLNDKINRIENIENGKNLIRYYTQHYLYCLQYYLQSSL